jgi:hypothetical protein
MALALSTLAVARRAIPLDPADLAGRAFVPLLQTIRASVLMGPRLATAWPAVLTVVTVLWEVCVPWVRAVGPMSVLRQIIVAGLGPAQRC